MTLKLDDMWNDTVYIPYEVECRFYCKSCGKVCRVIIDPEFGNKPLGYLPDDWSIYDNKGFIILCPTCKDNYAVAP